MRKEVRLRLCPQVQVLAGRQGEVQVQVSRVQRWVLVGQVLAVSVVVLASQVASLVDLLASWVVVVPQVLLQDLAAALHLVFRVLPVVLLVCDLSYLEVDFY